MGLLNCPWRHKIGVGEKADGNKANRSEGVGRGRGAANERETVGRNENIEGRQLEPHQQWARRGKPAMNLWGSRCRGEQNRSKRKKKKGQNRRQIQSMVRATGDGEVSGNGAATEVPWRFTVVVTLRTRLAYCTWHQGFQMRSWGGHRRLHLAFPAAGLTALGEARAPRCLAALRAAAEGKSGPATTPSTWGQGTGGRNPQPRVHWPGSLTDVSGALLSL